MKTLQLTTCNSCKGAVTIEYNSYSCTNEKCSMAYQVIEYVATYNCPQGHMAGHAILHKVSAVKVGA
jgi:hypothetical protein